ncbi:Penicillin-binding protein 1A/1B [Actinomyces bovis]|uniref:Penicillin-binding protein 1A/1B n=1 Tax=Actinomyces bovis TaxID=1658 RepID=A0ABY1VQU2_9ACTO|nr:transglycosylase domain-containing protein [Actinomyces bovis]SPT54294.1 Penicillin-binding protein 1A/1B [Actinomyces bovis]VEG56365.1 Penicillin-binding protein 1A/1B [Actinomyces israelii]
MSPSASARGKSLGSAQVISMLLVFSLLAVAGGVLSAGFAVPFVGAASAITKASQDMFNELPSDFNVLEPSQVSDIKAADGTQIATFYAENRIVVPLSEISPNLQNAVVAVEDRRFYQHKGVDPTGMVRALVKNASSSSTQGASTLTQQYVRNVLIEAGLQSGDSSAITAARASTFTRKLKEVKYALTLEKQLSKQKILEGYLNLAAFSPSTYGVEASARHYFSHSAKEMSVAEAALLAGLTNAPSAYDPVSNPEAATSRMSWVLDKMLHEQFIDQAQYDEAKATPIEQLLKVQDTVGGCGAAGSAAYFCNYVVSEILNSEVYGKDKATRKQLLLRGGLTITTTLDMAKQQAAQASIEGHVPTGDPSNAKAALVSIQPGTGRIIAMAQNTAFGDPQQPGDTSTQISFSADAAHEGTTSNGFQPGSVFKTFVLAEWYRLGRSAHEVLNTTPRTFNSSEWKICGGPGVVEPWPVKNVLPSESGKRSVYESAVQSINVGFAEMLTRMDICDVTKLAASVGIKKADGTELEPLPAIILGSMNTPPLTMANAYATFAARGVYCTPIAIDSITDKAGNSLQVPSANCAQAIEQRVADQVNATLTAVFSGSGTAAAGALPGRVAAGKTGTTDNSEHTWFVGYTPQLSTAAWTGHSDGTYSLSYQWIGGRYYDIVYGNTISVPLWHDYMVNAMQNEPVQGFAGANLGTKPAPTQPQPGQKNDKGDKKSLSQDPDSPDNQAAASTASQADASSAGSASRSSSGLTPEAEARLDELITRLREEAEK